MRQVANVHACVIIIMDAGIHMEIYGEVYGIEIFIIEERER